MSQPETVTVDTPQLACDGGNSELGHPRVFLTMKNGSVDCPYCGRHYVLSKDAKKTAAY